MLLFTVFRASVIFSNTGVRDCGKYCNNHLNKYIQLEDVKVTIVYVHGYSFRHWYHVSSSGEKRYLPSLLRGITVCCSVLT